MARHTETDIYRATYDLSNLITGLVANMSRNFRTDFGAELRRRCMDLVMKTYQANTSQDPGERVEVLRRMREEVKP